MYNFTETQYQIEIKPILRKIFVNDNPFDQTFSSNMIERLIVSPCGNYTEPELFEGLIAAASNLGEQNCYITNLLPDKKATNHYYIFLSELYEEYVSIGSNIMPTVSQLDINLWIEYAIYSEQGTWGLMISHEHHGLLGGSTNFIHKIRELVPALDEQVEFFLQKWQSISSITNRKFDWLPKLLIHVYGQKKGRILLENINVF